MSPVRSDKTKHIFNNTFWVTIFLCSSNFSDSFSEILPGSFCDYIFVIICFLFVGIIKGQQSYK